jgi:hypothetical protein
MYWAELQHSATVTIMLREAHVLPLIYEADVLWRLEICGPFYICCDLESDEVAQVRGGGKEN